MSRIRTTNSPRYGHFQNSKRPNRTSTRPPYAHSSKPNATGAAYTNPFQQKYADVDTSPSFLSFNAVSYLSLIMTIFLFITMVIKRAKKNTDITKMCSSKRGKIILLFIIFMFLSFLTANGIAIAFCAKDLITNTLSDKKEYRTMIAYVRIIYRFGRLILTMFFLSRMYMCFMNTPLQIPKKYVLTLSFMYFTFCWLLGTFANAAYLIKEIELHQLVSIFNLISFSVDMLINTVILCLFIRTLFKIVLEQNRDFSVSRSGTNDETKKVNLNQNQVNIIDTIVKNTVLVIWGVCSSFVPEIFAVVSVYFDRDGNKTKGSPIDPILLCILLLIDGVINCICVYLSFSWAKTEYDFVCNCCDKCLANACIRCTEKLIEKRDGIPNKLAALQMKNSVKSKSTSAGGTTPTCTSS